MVVLDARGMLTSGTNQYLQPDYLTPLPTTLDAKKSPLALLAQTCSQIGADTSNKPLIPPIEKSKKDEAPKEKTPVNSSHEKLAFKPYESSLKKSSTDEIKSYSNDDEKKSGGRTPSSVKSASPGISSSVSQSTITTTCKEDGKSKDDGKSESGKRESTPTSRSSVNSPIIRSGLEILQGHPKDIPLGTYKPSMVSSVAGLAGLSALGSLGACCPPGFDPALMANPAFRTPFPSLSAHAMMGYPPTSLASSPSPYVSYARVKTSTGAETLVPVCRDPYCTGCQFSMHNAQQLLASSATCPGGCSQCDHQKLSGLGLSPLIPGLAPPGSSSAAAAAAALSYSQHAAGMLGSQRPYVCNWIQGDTYCGKRFSSSDELLQHLRTHTNIGSSDASSLSLLTAAAVHPHSFLTSPVAGLHRTYPNPPLSPLSAARYHPYSKPGLPTSLASSPLSPFNPALAPYYCSPYSIYGQRIGAAVHP